MRGKTDETIKGPHSHSCRYLIETSSGNCASSGMEGVTDGCVGEPRDHSTVSSCIKGKATGVREEEVN